MSDAIIVKDEELPDDIPDLTFQEELSDDIEVIIGNQEPEPEAEPEPDPEKVALKERLEALEASLVAQREQVDLVGAIKDLTSNQPVQSPVPQQVNQPVETEEELEARLNENWVDNPYKAMLEFQQKKVAPLAQEMMANNVFHSKKDLERDPERKETFVKYRSEIEEEVSKVLPQEKFRDPEVYTRAHDRVVSRHINEIIASKVQEAIAAQSGEETKIDPPPVSHSERGGPGVPQKTKTIRLTAAQAERARSIGLSNQQYYRILERRKQGGVK
jgi:hypothetical protein